MQKSKIIKNAFYMQFTAFLVASLTSNIGSIVDGVIIGQYLGSGSIAAYGLVNPLLVIFTLLGSVVSAGARNHFTLLIGKGRLRDAQGVFSLSLILSVGLAAVFMIVLLLFATPICMLLGAVGQAADLLPEARNYLVGICIGLPAMNAIRILNNYLPIDNDRKLPVISSAVLTVTDITLDLVVAFVIHGGTFAMGLATSLSYYAALMVLLLHFRRKENILRFSFRSLPWGTSGHILSKGIPIGICRIGHILRTTFMNHLLAIIASAAAIAAYSVHREADNIFRCITISMAETVAMIAGILVGEEDRPRIKRLLNTSLQATIFVTLSASVLLWVFAPQFAALYIRDDPEAFRLSVHAAKAYAIGLPFYGLSMIYFNYFQGIGKSVLSSLSGFLSECAFLVLSAWVLSRWIGAEAVWYALPATQALMLLYYIIVIAIESRRLELMHKPFSDRLLLLPRSFDTPEQDRRYVGIRTMEEVIRLSEEAWEYCRANGCDTKKSYYISLAIEEMLGNIIQHGFSKDNRKHSIDVRISHKGDDFSLRIRDDCFIFDPVKQLELYSDDDKIHGIGLRMIIHTAKDVHYTSILGLNNLSIRV